MKCLPFHSFGNGNINTKEIHGLKKIKRELEKILFFLKLCV